MADSANAIGYVRVSTDEQELSLDVQAARIRGMALARGFALADVLVDSESGKSLHRAGLTQLLARVDARAADTVVIAKLDRLTRSVTDLAVLLQRFEKRGVALVSVAESLDTGSAMGRMLVYFIVLMAQWEREVISERTRDALQFKKAHGERVGTIPFGYHLAADGIHLDEDADEQALLARIRELKADGRSTRQIADALNGAGWTTRRGTAWRFQYVARMIAAGFRRATGDQSKQAGLFEALP